MANHASAKKRAKQNPKRAKINSSRRNRIKTFIKKIEAAIASGDSEAAASAFKAAQPEIMRGVSKGIMHKKTASRKISRLSARLKSSKTTTAKKRLNFPGSRKRRNRYPPRLFRASSILYPVRPDKGNHKAEKSRGERR